ncbi:MAG: hypothetical protein NTV54_08595 [Ignavibacteriales bacterium]|nr:hypothetical protein [Ignavibacteriales bacterium]
MANMIIKELFPKTLTLKNVEVRDFKNAVIDEVKSHGGRLEFFHLESGIVSMGIDNEGIAQDLKSNLEQMPGVKVNLFINSLEEFVTGYNEKKKEGKSL